ncbi:uncharacterized protein LOC101651714 [Echinops telfairi]|uniref:Uncharacterized protein LOC101651714 n=1 Tax=Echinops telfairi TaxID=9371 RepID=A0AC55CLI6_ECHTE|nr:uncharacterized protein LOC101651714 [Echinops telfairi]
MECGEEEAEQELLARVQGTLGSVSQGHNVALLLRGCEGETPRLVPQLLQALFEEGLSHRGSDRVLSTLSLVQLSSSGRARDLLSPGTENLSVLDVPPLGLVVEDATEVEVPGLRAASELYLQVTKGEGRDCPLLQVLAGAAIGEKVEGSLPWIISWLLGGNNYSCLLLRLDPKGSPLSLLQAALLGASKRRKEVKVVKPTRWDPEEEARARRAGLRTLRSDLLGSTLTSDELNQLSRALRELQVVKTWNQHAGHRLLRDAKAAAMGLPEAQQVMDSAVGCRSSPQQEPPGRSRAWSGALGRTAGLRSGSDQEHPPGNSEEQAQQAPEVALQVFLAQARRQRLREQHQSQIREELKHLEQEEEEVASDQVKGPVAGKVRRGQERQRWCRECRVLRLQLEGLQAERDAAEHDLVALYDLNVQATRAQTGHVLQVFRAWRRQWEQEAMATEHRYRSLLAGVLQDAINLASQNQELQLCTQQLHQGAD